MNVPTNLFPNRPPGTAVTIGELCAVLNVSRAALSRLIKAERWPAPAHVGAFARWTVAECNAAFDALRSRDPIPGRGPAKDKKDAKAEPADTARDPDEYRIVPETKPRAKARRAAA